MQPTIEIARRLNDFIAASVRLIGVLNDASLGNSDAPTVLAEACAIEQHLELIPPFVRDEVQRTLQACKMLIAQGEFLAARTQLVWLIRRVRTVRGAWETISPTPATVEVR